MKTFICGFVKFVIVFLAVLVAWQVLSHVGVAYNNGTEVHGMSADVVYTVVSQSNGYRSFVSDPIDVNLWFSSKKKMTYRCRINDDTIIGLEVGDRFMVNHFVKDGVMNPDLKVTIIPPKG